MMYREPGLLSALQKSAATLVLLGSTMLPSLAHAKDAVVSPLVSRGVDPLIVLNMTSLIASELDFMMAYENVDQMETMPTGMGSKCLSSTSCLGKIARDNAADAVVAGALAAVGSTHFDIHLVLYEGGAIKRRKDFSVENAPSKIADAMGSFVKELVTGKSMAQKAQEDSLGEFETLSDADMFDDEEDFEVEIPDTSVSRRIQTPPMRTDDDEFADLDDFDLMGEDEEDQRRQAEEEARVAELRRQEEAARQAQIRRQAEEEARLAEEQRRAEEEAIRLAEAQRRAAEEAAIRLAESQRRAEEETAARLAEDRRRAEDEAARLAREEDSMDVDDFSFGSTTATDIEVEEVQFGSAAASIKVAEDVTEDLDDEADDLYDFSSADQAEDYLADTYGDEDLDEDLDEDRSSRRENRRNLDDDEYDATPMTVRTKKTRDNKYSNTRSSRSSSSSRSTSANRSTTRVSNNDGVQPSAALTGRVGYSRFQSLNFLTYGVEAAFLASDNLALIGGIEAYSVKRVIPEALLDVGDPTVQWNTILPFNAGVLYRFTNSNVQPYLGPDIQFIPGYVKESGDVAMGFRGRIGVDFLLSSAFGLNLNTSAGLWSGHQFQTVEDTFSSMAMVPQISGGTVLLF